MFLEPLLDNSGHVAWRIILLVTTITSRVHFCHEWVHLVRNEVQILHSCQKLSYWDNGPKVPQQNIS